MVFLLSIFLILKKRRGAILYYPIIGTLLDIFKGYHLHNFVTENYRFWFLVILYFIYYFPYLKYRKSRPIMVFIIYLFVLLMFNPLTDSWRPSQISAVVNAASILFMFLIGYHYMDSMKKLKTLYHILLVNSLILYVYFIVIQLFPFELLRPDSSYSTVFKSHHFDYDIYTVSFTILITFFFRWNLTNKRERLINTFFLISNLILLIIFMKRWAIFCTFVGLLLYLFYSSKNMIPRIRSLSFIFVLTIIASFFFKDIIINQFANRGDKVSGFKEMKREGRTLDYINTYHYISTNDSAIRVIFGGNIFESRDFGMKYLNEVRNIHPDVLSLIYGVGFFGFFLYYYIYKWLFSKARKLFRESRQDLISRDLYSLVRVFLFVLLFISIAGGAVRVNTADSLAFFLIGASIKLIECNKKNLTA